MTVKPTTKIWTTIGIFDTYEEAAKQKNLVAEKVDLVKIKRCGGKSSRYKVKTWAEPKTIPTKKKKKKGRKNVDQTIR